MQIENIQGMLLQSPGADTCGHICVCAALLSSPAGKEFQCHHTWCATSGFSMWFSIGNHPLGFCGSGLKWNIQTFRAMKMLKLWCVQCNVSLLSCV